MGKKFRRLSTKAKKVVAKKAQRKQKAVAEETARQEANLSNLPHSMVFRRGKVGEHVARLIHDMRKVLAPLTAEKLRESSKNDLKDFFHAAGLLNVSHFMIFSQTAVGVNMRIARIPRGPTLTFRVLNYSTIYALVQSQKRPHAPGEEFSKSPLLVLNGFSSPAKHMQIMATHLSNLFPPLDITQLRLASCRRVVMFNYNSETDTIDFRHYFVKIVPVGLTKGIRKVIKGKIPSMHERRDIADYVQNPATLSDSEAELPEDSHVPTPQNIDKLNRVGGTSALKLKEIGPRMTLQLVKIESEACKGEVLYHAHITKSEAEKKLLAEKHKQRAALRAERRAIQEANVLRKQKLKEEREQARAEARAERQRLRALKQASGQDASSDESEEGSEDESDNENNAEGYSDEGSQDEEDGEGGYFDDSDFDESESEHKTSKNHVEVSEDEESESETEESEEEESEEESEEEPVKKPVSLGTKRGHNQVVKRR